MFLLVLALASCNARTASFDREAYAQVSALHEAYAKANGNPGSIDPKVIEGFHSFLTEHKEMAHDDLFKSMELVYFELKGKRVPPDIRQVMGLPASQGLAQDIERLYSDKRFAAVK
jgi:hypothetical protein